MFFPTSTSKAWVKRSNRFGITKKELVKLTPFYFYIHSLNLSLAQAIIHSFFSEINLLSGPQIISLIIKLLPLLQCFHKLVDTTHLLRNIDALRTLPDTLVTTYTMVCLTKFGYRTVITNQKGSTEFPIIIVL